MCDQVVDGDINKLNVEIEVAVQLALCQGLPFFMLHGHSKIVLDPTAPFMCNSTDMEFLTFRVVILSTNILVSHIEVVMIMFDVRAEKVLSRHIKFSCQHEVRVYFDSAIFSQNERYLIKSTIIVLNEN